MDSQDRTADSPTVEHGTVDHDVVVTDSLVEEVSIDGMCGVY